MKSQQTPVFAHHHFSVDCVLFGFDQNKLKVLLTKRSVDDIIGAVEMKLPGGLIYQDEDLNVAAARILKEHSGLEDIPMLQFKAFSSKDRISNIRDRIWLEREMSMKISSIMTVGYVGIVQIEKQERKHSIAKKYPVLWQSFDSVGVLAFDHNVILSEALDYLRFMISNNFSYIFSLLPRKFTVAQLRTIMEIIQGHTYDVKNFHKKLHQMPYVVQLEEKETGVAHRAAHYYKFDKRKYRTAAKGN